MRRVLALVAITAALFCVVNAFNAFGLSAEEQADLAVNRLPEDAYLRFRVIGDEYGSHAAEYWRYVIYEGTPQHWAELKRIAATFPTVSDELDKQVQSATAAEFKISPSDARVHALATEYEQIQERVPELNRRLSFAQRFKDTMAYVGGASLLGVVGWMLWHFGRSNPTVP